MTQVMLHECYVKEAKTIRHLFTLLYYKINYYLFFIEIFHLILILMSKKNQSLFQSLVLNFFVESVSIFE